MKCDPKVYNIWHHKLQSLANIADGPHLTTMSCLSGLAFAWHMVESGEKVPGTIFSVNRCKHSKRGMPLHLQEERRNVQTCHVHWYWVVWCLHKGLFPTGVCWAFQNFLSLLLPLSETCRCHQIQNKKMQAKINEVDEVKHVSYCLCTVLYISLKGYHKWSQSVLFISYQIISDLCYIAFYSCLNV